MSERLIVSKGRVWGKQRRVTSSSWKNYAIFPSYADENSVLSILERGRTWVPVRENRTLNQSEIIAGESHWIRVDCLKGKTIWMPTSLEAFVSQVRASEKIIDMPVDPENEEGPKYSRETWERVAQFLLCYAQEAHTTFGIVLPTPKISPGSAGSIDVLWRNPKFRFLLKIPKDVGVPASYYGDDRGLNKVQGTLDVGGSLNAGLVLSVMGI